MANEKKNSHRDEKNKPKKDSLWNTNQKIFLLREYDKWIYLIWPSTSFCAKYIEKYIIELPQRINW